MDPQDLRDLYLGMSVYVKDGKNLAHGNRFLYLVGCSRGRAEVYDSTGTKKTVLIKHLDVDRCHDVTGAEIPHRISAGHLEVEVDGIWRRICTWK